MAYTKIKPIRTRLDTCVNYVLNKEKTDLYNALGYIMNEQKTGGEQALFETAINCNKETAFQDMMQIKRRFDKTKGVLGYHVIQSFKPDEITGQKAHELGISFAEECFGKRFQVVVATHLDQAHLHNHLIVNSVSFIDGMKYTNTFKDYYQEIRGISDRICKENGLSIIQEPAENKSLNYIEWLAVYKGKASWNTIIKNDIDAAVAKAPSYGAFLVLMEHQGYEIKEGKYLSFRPMGKERFSRGYKLGKEYSKEAIKARIDGNEFLEKLPVSYAPKRRRYVKVPMPNVLRIYWRYMYLLGKVKKHQAPPRMSVYLKQELLKFESYKAQFRFIHQHSLYSEADISAFVSSHQAETASLYESLSELKKRYQPKAAVFSALSDKAKYQQAHQLFQSGYTIMVEESEKYLKAVRTLKKSGYANETDLEKLLDEKIALTGEMDAVKTKINMLMKEIRQCEKIQETLPKMKEHIEPNQERTLERSGDSIDRH